MPPVENRLLKRIWISIIVFLYEKLTEKAFLIAQEGFSIYLCVVIYTFNAACNSSIGTISSLKV